MMETIFSENSRFYCFMMKVWDLVLLNALWLLTSFPLITIGASTTALFTVLKKAVKNEESYLGRSYFKAFKENFRQATALWGIMLAAGGILVTDIYIMGRLSQTVNGMAGSVLTGVITVLLIVLILTLIYVFPMQSRYENTVWMTLFKSMVFSIQYFGYTFRMIGSILLPLGAILMVGKFTGTGLAWCVFFYLSIGFSATAYLTVYPWQGLTKKLEALVERETESRTLK